MPSPLQGKQVVITRAASQAQPLASLLRSLGADPILYPCLDFAPPADPGPLHNAGAQLSAGKFDLLVLTSATTVDALARLRVTIPPSTRVAVVGPATAEAARAALATDPEFIPDTFAGEALGNAIRLAEGDRILLPQSALADNDLEQILTRRGGQVTRVAAYRTVIGTGGADLPSLLRSRRVDALTLTSGSSARHLLERLGPAAGLALSLPTACIGSKTAAVARNLGFSDLIVPAEHTLASMVDALAARLGTP